ncbi:tetratricopeptide repeat protein [Gaetbulibacter saemankumensis]|uniref:tetratricopeptide repeat protein n=1 Tax=Gaetbulibacter saemankumensis TaxID=311208 RepID=UPI00040EB2A7|nr:tetratricopeptide repeat protein [Gaetbulibacter saemankumensis]
MKNIVLIILTLITSLGYAQDAAMEETAKLAAKRANAYVYEGNNLLSDEDFISAEMAYRKAVSEQPASVAGIYNLGNSYIEKGNFEEALYRHQQAAKVATSKEEKHKTFHNIGNILMKNKKCKEAVEAYKNALRNNPADEETRYNLGLAKICAEQQQDQNQDDQDKDNKDNQDNQDNKDQNKDQENKDNQDNQDKEGDDKKDNQDEGDQDKKDGEDEKDDEGKPKDEKEDQGKGDEEKKDQPQQKPQPGKLSPQQIKNLLEAMNNQEEKVQEKMNAEKKKGVKVKTEKDW